MGRTGDPGRFDKFALYIIEHYKPPLRVADVAGGRSGKLNEILTRVGYEVVTIDPVFTNTELKGEARKYESSMAQNYDLIVGMHPDEATEDIVYSAKVRPIVLVPCCKHWTGREMRGTRNIRGTIRKYFRDNEIDFVEEYLKIRGANLVFRTR